MTEKNAQWEGIVGAARVQVQERFKEIFQSLDFGAYIRPEHYFVSYIFKTTEEMNRAEKSVKNGITGIGFIFINNGKMQRHGEVA